MPLPILSPGPVPPPREDEFVLVPAGPGDRFFDYCLEPYQPRHSHHGRLRAETLLWHSLQHTGALERFDEPLRAIQSSVGPDLTVWGVKFDGARLWWELYFYDPQKESAEATASSLTRVLAPWIPIVPSVRETIPYQMVSFDLRPESIPGGRIEELNLYLTGSRDHAGRSYSIGPKGLEHQNFYRFLPPKEEIDEVLGLLKSSAFVDYSDPAVLSKVLIPQLFPCKKICVAKKRFCDAVYFSGVDVGRLLWFMKHFAYPAPLVAFLERHREAFDHLWFDVGIDYRQKPDGRIEFLKTSYYGTL